MWNLQKSASDCASISSNMALSKSGFWKLTKFLPSGCRNRIAKIAFWAETFGQEFWHCAKTFGTKWHFGALRDPLVWHKYCIFSFKLKGPPLWLCYILNFWCLKVLQSDVLILRTLSITGNRCSKFLDNLPKCKALSGHYYTRGHSHIATFWGQEMID